VYPREVVMRALHHRAHSVVLAHNHPSGQPTPSPADVAMTSKLSAALGLIDISVLDHIIVTAHAALSMSEAGLIGGRA
jgi:DNA repair protein RadC